MSTLIVRHSKYDFWIPDEILTLEKNLYQKNIFFEVENLDQKKSDPKKFIIKNRKNRFFEKSFFLFFVWFRKKIGPIVSIFDIEKKWSLFFLESKFRQESKNHT